MAVASYTTDLTLIADMDTVGGTAVEPNTLYTAGRSPIEDDEDFPIQGTVHASLTQNATGKGGILVPGTSWTYSSGDYIFGWIIWLAPSTIATQANGGLCMLLGSSSSVFDVHYVGGSDYGAYPYGGWQNFVVDPERTPDESAGNPTAYHYVGAGANCISKVSKGNPLGFDVFRYGRGELRVVGGTSTDTDATFAGMANVNDNNSNRWGLFQAIEGGYKWKGMMVLGYGGACDFTDSDVNIVIDNTEMVDSDFNRIELRTAASAINWTNIGITALGTVSKGELEMIDNCTFNDTGGAFTDMNTFDYLSNATITNRTFRRCGLVTQGGATLDTCRFDKASGAIALNADDMGLVTDCTFISDGSNHAVDLGTISSTQSVTWENYLIDYASTDGSTGNEAITVNVGTGITLTINISAGYDVPSVRNTNGSPGTITKVSSVSLTISGLPSNTEVTIVKTSDRSELFHVENSSGDVVYSYGSAEVGLEVDILIHHIDYDPHIGNYFDYTLPSADTPILVNLISDETYNNPT